jgi:3-deoxy-manno-octulosonate cytidylyltransferase (CMP-KDO synthetase)
VTSLTIIIPARKASTRFPAKILHPVLGKPLVLWVVEGATRSKRAERVIVATDDNEILETVKEAGFEARMTRIDHPSGTDRVWEVASGLSSEWIMNLQGDEPLMTGDVLDSLYDAALKADGVEMATLVRSLNPKEADDPNRVKVVTGLNGDALYFSRSRVPYPRNPRIEAGRQKEPEYLLHVGIYLYRRDTLERFVSLPQAPLERVEGLEQLRALENGIRIKCVRTDHEFMSVDTIDDVKRVEAELRARGY